MSFTCKLSGIKIRFKEEKLFTPLPYRCLGKRCFLKGCKLNSGESDFLLHFYNSGNY